jgi:hypothetical protein
MQVLWLLQPTDKSAIAKRYSLSSHSVGNIIIFVCDLKNHFDEASKFVKRSKKTGQHKNQRIMHGTSSNRSAIAIFYWTSISEYLV